MFLYTVLIIFFFKGITCQQVIQTQNGPVQGSLEYSEELNTPYHRYLGIPFAKPPLGNLRFEPPQDVDNWTETLICTTSKPKCLQTSTITLNGPQGSEDCLYLDIYVPESCVGGACNVLVYIHGGRFMSGSAKEIYGGHLVDKGIIVIAVQYRLAALGFLTQCNKDYPGNMGLKDCRAALMWVKKNCESFGGDPNKITIGGDSSGAITVGYLIQSESCRGLFHRAILQSGSTLDEFAHSRVCPNNESFFYEKIATDQNITVAEVTMPLLKQMDPKIIQQASTTYSDVRLLLDFKDGIMFGPTTEQPSETAIILGKSYDILNSGSAPFPELKGTMFSFTSMEAQFTLSKEVLELTRDVIVADYNVPKLFVPRDVVINDPLEKNDLGLEIKNRFFPPPNTVSTAPLCEMVVPYFSEEIFVRGILRNVQLLLKNNHPVYLFRWGYVSKTQNFACPDFVGHASDMLFIFQSWKNLTDPTDKLFCYRMRNTFANFIITGVPNTELNDPEFVDAGKDAVEEGYNCYDFAPNGTVEVQKSLFKSNMDFWNSRVFPRSEVQSFYTY